MINRIIILIDDQRRYEVGLLFCDKGYMQHLNKSFRNKDYPTDVLSFPFMEEDKLGEDSKSMQIKSRYDYLGDIATCFPVAEKQALDYNTTLEMEIKRLIIHGILHLFGYDHEKSNQDQITMEQKENLLFLEVKKIKIC